MIQRMSHARSLLLPVFLVVLSFLFSSSVVAQDDLETWLTYQPLLLPSADILTPPVVPSSIAVADTLMVVGSSTSQRAIVYEFVVDGFIPAAVLTADDRNDATALFGAAVAVAPDDSRILVGAPGEDAVYSFEPFSTADAVTIWQQVQKLEGTAASAFGSSLSLDGDRLAVGATQGGATKSGQVVLLDRNPSTGVWIEPGETVEQTDDTTASTVLFGNDVALSDDTLAVAAVGKDANQGSVYLFALNDATWMETDRFDGTDPAAGFGTSIALFASRLVVGEPGMDQVHIYQRSFGPDVTSITLDANTTSTDDNFGTSVALFGDTLVVGAPNVNTDEGAVYVFRRDRFVESDSEEVWTKVVELAPDKNANTTTAGDLLGSHVALWNEFVASTAFANSTAFTGFLFIQDPDTQEPSMAPSLSPSIAPSNFPEEICAEFFRQGCRNDNAYLMHKFIRPNDRFGNPMGCRTKCIRRRFLQLHQRLGYQCGSCSEVL